MLLKSILCGVGLALSAHLCGQVVEPPLVLSIRLHVLGFVTLTGWLWKGLEQSLAKALAVTFITSLTYTVTLVSSIATYRLYLHRLRSIPGETIHKLTMFSWLPIDWQGKRPTHLQALHAKYGTVIRIGPRHVSISDYKALSSIYSSTALRGPWYSAQDPSPNSTSLQTETNLSRHNDRRKDWDLALSVKSLKDCRPIIASLAEKLLTRLTTIAQKANKVDIGEYFGRYSMDCSSQLALGRNLGLLEHAKTPPMVEPLEERLRMMNTVAYVPYCVEAVRLIPSSTKDFDEWVKAAVQSRVEESKDSRGKPANLADYLLQWVEMRQHLAADASLFIRHGSDTIRSTLTWCLRELIKKPIFCKRLEKELYDIFGSKAANDFDKLRDNCPFLNACINETLRLWPPIPSGLQRVTPAKGMKILDDIQLPPNVIVSIPTYTIQRDSANFSSPNQFQPTRWFPNESIFTTHKVAAFSPFGHGATSCVGRALSLMQCRIILARLIQSFDISSVANSEDEDISSKYRDQNTIASAPCLVKLVPR